MFAGIWSGHDSSYALFNKDQLVQHCEIERHLREKEIAFDSLQFMQDQNISVEHIEAFATCWSTNAIKRSPIFHKIANKRLHVISHHEAHAADARFNSKFESCAILVVDGGGYDDNANTTIATSLWISNNPHHLQPVLKIHENDLNVGGIWTRATRYVFGLESGWPQGHQAGSVMAMSAFGDPKKYSKQFMDAFTVDRIKAQSTPVGHVKGMSAKDPRRPIHKYWAHLEQQAKSSEQEMFDLAAGLQNATETIVFSLIEKALTYSKNICFTGGVALNTVIAGKLLERYPEANFFIPAIPYDGGLCIGAVKHMLHIADKVPWSPSESWNVPYYGQTYVATADITKFVSENHDITSSSACDKDVIELLSQNKIVAVFSGQSESGRRALGHRSILANPASSDMKNIVNERVKHRQNYRPFAPSVLREHVSDWFELDVDSPYMSFVVRFKPEAAKKVPAVVHHDGTARLQTLTKRDNAWFYDFVKLWHQSSGIPMLLNTSFNDREPICETPQHALHCFKNTDIDALYFIDQGLLLTKRR
jgi:carbamoyltransferase